MIVYLSVIATYPRPTILPSMQRLSHAGEQRIIALRTMMEPTIWSKVYEREETCRRCVEQGIADTYESQSFATCIDRNWACYERAPTVVTHRVGEDYRVCHIVPNVHLLEPKASHGRKHESDKVVETCVDVRQGSQ